MPKFFLCLFFLLIPAGIYSGEPDKKLHQKCIYPTVMVSGPCHLYGGSGFIVRSAKIKKHYENVVITAAHNLLGEDMIIRVSKYENTSTLIGYDDYPMSVVVKNDQKDWAILIFQSEKKMPYAELDFSSKLYIGTKIFHVGHGCLDDARLDFGIITQPKSLSPPSLAGRIRTNAHVIQGDSGGPLFTENYKVVGIAEAIRNFMGQRVFLQSYFVPVSEIKTYNEKSAKNALDFVYNPSAKMPVMPRVRLKLLDYHYDIEENK